MAKGRITCPACNGKGKITEDETVYEFVSRDPITSKCLVCNGRGMISPQKKLPNGEMAKKVAEKIRLGEYGVARQKQSYGGGRPKSKPAINPVGSKRGGGESAARGEIYAGEGLDSRLRGNDGEQRYEVVVECGASIMLEIWKYVNMEILHGGGVEIRIKEAVR